MIMLWVVATENHSLMKQVDRTKVCWNCEADVSFEATYCPFCGTDLLTSSIETPAQTSKQDRKFADQTLQESLASLYKPPYSVRNRQGLGVPDEREESSYIPAEPQKKDPLFESTYEMPEEKGYPMAPEKEIMALDDGEEMTKRGSVLPLLFLMIGGHLLMLGALLLFCSSHGKVVLEWSSRFWFVYC
jgi:ribosomal protein L40E